MKSGKASRYSQLGQQKVVDIAETRIAKLARVERSVGERHTLHIIFPTPGGKTPEHRLDLGFLLKFPGIADPFCDAFLELYRHVGFQTRKGAVTRLRASIVPFLEANHLYGITLRDFDDALVEKFIGWLNETEKGGKKYSYQSRRLAYGVFRAVLVFLATSEKWKGNLRHGLHVPETPWHGVHRRHQPTEILGHSDIERLYRYCVAQVSETVALYAWAAEVIAKDDPDEDVCALSFREYLDSDERCVRALNRLYPGVVPGVVHLSRTGHAVGRAMLKKANNPHILRAFQPTQGALIPFAVLLAIHFAYNPTTVFWSKLDDYQHSEVLGQSRLVANASKTRSKRRQMRSVPASDQHDNPAFLIEFLKKWTGRIRPYAPPGVRSNLFLFVSFRGMGPGASPVRTFEQATTRPTDWSIAIKTFCKAAGVDFTFKQIRHTVIDIAHDLFAGDLLALKEVSQHRHPETLLSHYTSDAARKRNDERLAQVMAVRDRWRETSGRIDPRQASDDGTDICSATPGWTCLDPYSSPLPTQQEGRLCTEYGMCPSCPLGVVDLSSPVAFRRTVQLKERIEEAQTMMLPEDWLASWRPVYDAIINRWVPSFPEDVRTAATSISLSPLPPVE